MTLSQFLSRQKMTRAQFAVLVRAHPVSVSKWCSGVMLPRANQMDAITAATGGAVTANDMQANRRQAAAAHVGAVI